MMGQSEYGLYALVISVVGYLTVLDFGLGNAIIRYTARYRALEQKDKEYSLNGMFLILYSIIGLIAIIIGVVLYLNINNMFGKTMTVHEIETAKILMILLIFNLSISFPLSVFGSIIMAYEDFIFVRIVNIGRTLVNPCIMVPLLLLGYRSIGMVVVTVSLNIICNLLNMFYCFNRLKIKIFFNKIDFKLLREIVGYSFFIFLNIIMDQIYWNSGQFILGAVSGTIAISVFAVAMQFRMYYMSFSIAISSLLLPKLSIMVAKNASNKEISDVFVKVSRIQYIIMSFILSGFIIIGREFINRWAGTVYDGAYYIALLIMVALIFPLIQSVGISILQAQNKMVFRTVTQLCVAVAGICISIPLANIYGGIGCAIGTTVSLIIGNTIVINIYYYKKIHIDIPRFWKEILRMSVPVVISLVCGFVIIYFIPNAGYLWIGLKIVLFSAFFVPLMWFIGMNPYEKDLFRQPVLKMLNRVKQIK
jgi:O-antigen/teichoic acid export membrane protein